MKRRLSFILLFVVLFAAGTAGAASANMDDSFLDKVARFVGLHPAAPSGAAVPPGRALR